MTNHVNWKPCSFSMQSCNLQWWSKIMSLLLRFVNCEPNNYCHNPHFSNHFLFFEAQCILWINIWHFLFEYRLEASATCVNLSLQSGDNSEALSQSTGTPPPMETLEQLSKSPSPVESSYTIKVPFLVIPPIVTLTI